MKTLEAQLLLTGTRPLMWHWFGPNAIPLEKQERTGVAGNDPEEWKRTVEKGSNMATTVTSLYQIGGHALVVS